MGIIHSAIGRGTLVISAPESNPPGPRRVHRHASFPHTFGGPPRGSRRWRRTSPSHAPAPTDRPPAVTETKLPAQPAAEVPLPRPAPLDVPTTAEPEIPAEPAPARRAARSPPTRTSPPVPRWSPASSTPKPCRRSPRAPAWSQTPLNVTGVTRQRPQGPAVAHRRRSAAPPPPSSRLWASAVDGYLAVPREHDARDRSSPAPPTPAATSTTPRPASSARTRLATRSTSRGLPSPMGGRSRCPPAGPIPRPPKAAPCGSPTMPPARSSRRRSGPRPTRCTRITSTSTWSATAPAASRASASSRPDLLCGAPIGMMVRGGWG